MSTTERITPDVNELLNDAASDPQTPEGLLIPGNFPEADVARGGIYGFVQGVGERVHTLMHGNYGPEMRREDYVHGTAETSFGTVHGYRIYNRSQLEGDEPNAPLVMRLPLGTSATHGIMIRKINALRLEMASQNRSLITIDHEGWQGSLTRRQLQRYDPQVAAFNTHDVLNGIEKREGVGLPRVMLTGDSLGGTLSYLGATDPIVSAFRRQVEAIFPTAAAGWGKLTPAELLMIGFQFGAQEAPYMARRALSPDSSRGDDEAHYLFRMWGEKPPISALRPIRRMAQELTREPWLKGVRAQIPEATAIYDVAFTHDPVSQPDAGDRQLSDGHQGHNQLLRGIHLSLAEDVGIDATVNALRQHDQALKAAA